MKTYGPYKRKDNRLHLVIKKDDNTLTSISYPKWLLQSHLGRELLGDETVDHIDGDFNNNNISNLQILSRAANAQKSAVYAEYIELICKCCNKEFIRRKVIHARSLKLKQDGPFCSNQCVGKIHH